MHNYVKQNMCVHFIIQEWKNKHTFLKNIQREKVEEPLILTEEETNSRYFTPKLTLSAEKDVFNPQLWDFGAGTQNFLRGGLMQYVVQNSIDGVILGGKNLPIKCPGRFETFTTNWMWEQANEKNFLPAPKGLAPILSINRCGDRDMLERPSFSLNIYNFGLPTANDVKKPSIC